MREPKNTAAAQALAALGVLALSLTAAVYFSPWLGLWLSALALVTFKFPPVGTSILFFVISLDVARPVFGGIFVSYSELEFAACLLAWWGWAAASRSPSDWDWEPVKWGAPMAAVLLASSLLNSGLLRGLPLALRMSELFFALWMLANSGLQTERRRFFEIALAASALFYSLAGFLQITEAPRTRIFSFFTNANQFGGYLALLLPVAASFFLFGSRRWARLGWGAVTATAGLALLASQSRGAILASLLAAALIVWTGLRSATGRQDAEPPGVLSAAPRLIRALLAVVLIWTAVVAAAFVGSPSLRGKISHAYRVLQERAGGDVIDDFVQYRRPYWEVGLRIWADHPVLGIGPGNLRRAVDGPYSQIVESYRTRLRRFEGFQKNVTVHLHNLYLQLAAETGVAGLAAFLWFLLNAFRRFAKIRGSVAGLGGLGLLTAFAAHNLVDVTFPSLGLEMGMLLGFLTASREEIQPRSAQ